MKDFVFHNPTKIIFGKSSMDKIAENVGIYGKKVLLTYGGGSIKTNGIYEKVKEQLKDFEVKEFSGIEPNPRVETIREAVKLAKEFQPDLVLAVGGGSVLDGTKLLVCSYYYEGDPWDFLVEKAKVQKALPFGAVLTVSATGSEMNSGGVITNWETKEKLSFGDKLLYPKFSILDPQNTFSLSAEQTAYGIVDIFSHVLEQYLNTTLDAPLQDRIAEGIILTLVENAQPVLKDGNDYDARANIMWCSTMALNDIIRSGVNQDWATHRIEHEFSAFYDIPHGAGLAVITPRWMEVTREQKMKKFAQYGRRVWELIGDDEEVSQNAITQTYNFFKSLGIKMKFSEWNIDEEHFPVMIDRLAKKGIGEIILTKEQISKILRNCI